MRKVIKTTFEKEQAEKDGAFLLLTPIQRLDRARQIREKMKKPEVDYSFSGMLVRIRKSL